MASARPESPHVLRTHPLLSRRQVSAGGPSLPEIPPPRRHGSTAADGCSRAFRALPGRSEHIPEPVRAGRPALRLWGLGARPPPHSRSIRPLVGAACSRPARRGALPSPGTGCSDDGRLLAPIEARRWPPTAHRLRPDRIRPQNASAWPPCKDILSNDPSGAPHKVNILALPGRACTRDIAPPT